MERATALVKLASLIRECGKALSTLAKGDPDVEEIGLADQLDAIAAKVAGLAKPERVREKTH